MKARAANAVTGNETTTHYELCCFLGYLLILLHHTLHLHNLKVHHNILSFFICRTFLFPCFKLKVASILSINQRHHHFSQNRFAFSSIRTRELTRTYRTTTPVFRNFHLKSGKEWRKVFTGSYYCQCN